MPNNQREHGLTCCLHLQKESINFLLPANLEACQQQAACYQLISLGSKEDGNVFNTFMGLQDGLQSADHARCHDDHWP